MLPACAGSRPPGYIEPVTPDRIGLPRPREVEEHVQVRGAVALEFHQPVQPDQA
ncbi:hypothetical protein GQL56_28785, partial [Pseudomonas putida]|nr:hypothetical protein [Pseudomonas putida]